MRKINSGYPNLLENDKKSRNDARNQNPAQMPNRDRKNNLSFAHQIQNPIIFSPSSKDLDLHVVKQRNNIFNEERKERDNLSPSPFFSRKSEDYSNRLTPRGVPWLSGNNGKLFAFFF